MLRSEALSNSDVIDILNSEFVPVWINVRETPLPHAPFWNEVLENARIGPDGRIVDAFSQGFFLRQVVVTPDGQTLLNSQAASVSGSMSTMAHESHFAYAQTNPLDVKNMLAVALRTYQSRAAAPAMDESRGNRSSSTGSCAQNTSTSPR